MPLRRPKPAPLPPESFIPSGVPLHEIDTAYGPDPITLAQEYGMTVGINWRGVPSVSDADAIVIMREGKRRGIEHTIKEAKYEELKREAAAKAHKARVKREFDAQMWRKREDAKFVAASQGGIRDADAYAIAQVGTEGRGAPGLPAGVPSFERFNPDIEVVLPEPELPVSRRDEFTDDEGEVLR